MFAQFPDREFTYDSTSRAALLEAAGLYFTEQLPEGRGVQFDGGPVVMLPHDSDWYGRNSLTTGRDQRPGVLVYEACTLADCEELDFSLYDNDGDGKVENVFILAAGGDELQDGVADHLMSQNWTLAEANTASGDYDKTSLEIDGVSIDRYVICSELRGSAEEYALTGIGLLCHETGHVLGLPDLYDVDYELSGGLAKGLWGSTTLMDHGAYNDSTRTPPLLNAIELEILGAGKCVNGRPGKYTLQPLSRERRFVRLGTDVPGEYYLIECRDNSGRDAFIGGSGLLIYHIDKTERDAGFSSRRGMNLTALERWGEANEVNCRPDRECAALVAADPEAVEVGAVFFPCGEVDSYGLLEHITANGDGSVSFEIARTSVQISGSEVFQDEAIIRWTCATGEACDVYVDGKPVAEDVAPYDAGNYAFILGGLYPKTSYIVEVVPHIGEPVSDTFVTKAYYKSVPPFIYLSGVRRLEDGSLERGTGMPLVVYGAPEAVSVRWTYDGKKIEPGPDAYFHPERSGLLKAYVSYGDGSVEVLAKELTVK